MLSVGRSTVLCADELLIFIRPLMSDELFSSDEGTLKPVGVAIVARKGAYASAYG